MILEALPLVVMWGIWRRINRLVFDRVDLLWEDVCDHIKLKVVCWLKAKDSSFPFFSVYFFIFRLEIITCGPVAR